ncbi:MAG: hypothetical protein K0Q74_523 [Gammaproteobacteria bacterium]|jgi:predicted AAA+ superfamily ATPase|nr:hypothetical protein [Gammaproteobacteria bacterium]
MGVVLTNIWLKMHRYLLNDLIQWKENPRRMPLILRGPRQVGKSYLIEMFGKTHFQQLVTINFELSPQLKSCFEQFEPATIINQLELALGVHITQDGQTLLFLDEIQEHPPAISALRYFPVVRDG